MILGISPNLHTKSIMRKGLLPLPLPLLLPLLIVFCSLNTTCISAQSLTWAEDIAPIFYKNCVSCHRDEGLGHFSLLGYDNAFSNRYAIQGATAEKRMPPWMPDPAFRQYAHENRLSDQEIQMISDWVDQDAPAGDLSQAPPMPVFSDVSEVGMPDHILQLPNYTVTATDDEYRCFVVPTGLGQVKFLRGLEAIPGNHQVVHHILIYEDTTGQAKALDQQTPNEPGYINFGGPGVQGARLVGAWVPGSRTSLMPPFMGIRLNPGADLIVQMHYPKGVTGMNDQTKLNLFFTPSNQAIREVYLAPILNHAFSLQNGPLVIPANTTKTFYAKYKTQQAGSFISVAPHMHLIGRNIETFAVTPQNDTIPLIRINDWDFHWQGGYSFQKVQKLPAQTTLHAYATYDNTMNNPHQPSNPPQLVTQGEATTDEMMLVYFSFMAYQPGDENIVLDSTLLQVAAKDLPNTSNNIEQVLLVPNPTEGFATLRIGLAQPAELYVDVLDLQGRSLQHWDAPKAYAGGTWQEQIDVSRLPAGTYMVRVRSSLGDIVGQRFVKI